MFIYIGSNGWIDLTRGLPVLQSRVSIWRLHPTRVQTAAVNPAQNGCCALKLAKDGSHTRIYLRLQAGTECALPQRLNTVSPRLFT